MGSQKPMSYWWPLSLGLTVVLLWITGGALLGSWASCVYECSTTLWYGGVGALVLSFFVKIAWIIVLIIYIRRRKYILYTPSVAPPYSAHAGLLDPRNQQYYPHPTANESYAYNPHYANAMPPSAQVGKEPLRHASPPEPPRGDAQAVRYCVQCSAPVYTPFCSNCGWSNPH